MADLSELAAPTPVGVLLRQPVLYCPELAQHCLYENPVDAQLANNFLLRVAEVAQPLGEIPEPGKIKRHSAEAVADFHRRMADLTRSMDDKDFNLSGVVELCGALSAGALLEVTAQDDGRPELAEAAKLFYRQCRIDDNGVEFNPPGILHDIPKAVIVHSERKSQSDS